MRANTAISPEQRESEAKRIEGSLQEFQAIFAPDSGPSPWRMSRAAVQAALFIVVYRDRPVLQQPFRLLAALMNVDELLTLWRYRHALMIAAPLGVRVGHRLSETWLRRIYTVLLFVIAVDLIRKLAM